VGALAAVGAVASGDGGRLRRRTSLYFAGSVIAQTSSDRQPDARATERVLVELLRLEREPSELAYVRRADALERVGDAIRRLGELTSPEGILPRAAAELGACSELDRVLISEVVDGALTPLAIWSGADQATADEALEQLRPQPIALAYPLLEYEVVRHHHAQTVAVGSAGARTPPSLARELGWESYAVAALTVGGQTIGLLHADATHSARPVDALDAEVTGKFAEGLAGVFERAVLRHTLALHRAELQSAVQWMSGRLGRLTDAASFEHPAGVTGADPGLVDSLTPRELEVLGLLAGGNTNLAIANTLVVREGTVKYHVKNILRKLGATSRADAVSRFVRATQTRSPG
jgi:LuxR family transcriptional regulator, regulator of acetate metabolism